MGKQGSCLCGSVTYEIGDDSPEAGVCHCSMCRKWTGGMSFAFKVPAGGMRIKGEDNIARYKSSDWAERAFCKNCGSCLFYRVTAEGPHQGESHVMLGTLDDMSGLELDHEIFIDEKPGLYALAGDRTRLTGAEVFAMFAQGDPD